MLCPKQTSLPCTRCKAICPEGGVSTMAKLTANYETVMIFNVQNGEEGIAALTEKFKNDPTKLAVLSSIAQELATAEE